MQTLKYYYAKRWNSKLINCDILIREKRKTLSITIGKNGEVIVKAPFGLNEKHINDFIKRKEKWIKNHTEKIKKLNKEYEAIISTKKIILFNTFYNVEEITGLKQPTFQNSTLYINNTNSFNERKNQIKQWYIKTAKELLNKRLEYFSNIMDLEYSSFKLTNAKTKWGSCSSTKKIDLNWRLIMLKSDLQDYVIVHELCHLLEMNHSIKFYKCVESVLKDYKKRRLEIKKSSFVLQLYR